MCKRGRGAHQVVLGAVGGEALDRGRPHPEALGAQQTVKGLHQEVPLNKQ
jgi:hypothetical protein